MVINKILHLTRNPHPVSHKLKPDDIVNVQSSSLYRENLYLVLLVTDNINGSIYTGEILGIEGFNRGDEGSVFRKLYSHDSLRFDFHKLKTGDTISFNINNVFE